MLEPPGRLPGILGMAVRACRPKLSFMNVAVARRALLAQSYIRVICIFELDFGAQLHGNPFCGVTFGARQLAMLAFQRELGKSSMIEFLGIELGDLERAPVVLLMAPRAVDLCWRRVVSNGVIAAMRRDLALDLLMTLQAFQAARSEAKVMAGGAVRRSFERLVRARQRSRRDLRKCGRGEEAERRLPPQPPDCQFCQDIG